MFFSFIERWNRLFSESSHKVLVRAVSQSGKITNLFAGAAKDTLGTFAYGDRIPPGECA